MNAYVSTIEWLREGSARNEDGDYVVLCDYFVQVTLADGSRFQHEVGFLGKVAYGTDEDYDFAYPVPGDKAAADRLTARVEAHLAAGGELDQARWHEVQAAYGSEAYQRNGCEYDQILREKAAG